MQALTLVLVLIGGHLNASGVVAQGATSLHSHRGVGRSLRSAAALSGRYQTDNSQGVANGAGFQLEPSKWVKQARRFLSSLVFAASGVKDSADAAYGSTSPSEDATAVESQIGQTVHRQLVEKVGDYYDRLVAIPASKPPVFKKTNSLPESKYVPELFDIEPFEVGTRTARGVAAPSNSVGVPCYHIPSLQHIPLFLMAMFSCDQAQTVGNSQTVSQYVVALCTRRSG